jgi:hypothetical protein
MTLKVFGLVMGHLKITLTESRKCLEIEKQTVGWLG